MPRKITAIDSTRREMFDSVRSKVSCAFCSRWRILTDSSSMAPMASAWLASMVLRSNSVRIASCSVSFGQPLAQRHGPRLAAAVSAMRCRSLSARSDITGMVFSIVSVLRRASSAERRGQRQIVGVGGDQHRGERLAGFAERRPDQRVAMPGGALDDRIEPGHVPAGPSTCSLIGLGDGGLHRAQFAKAVEEAVGDAFEPLDRSRQHRVGWRRAW